MQFSLIFEIFEDFSRNFQDFSRLFAIFKDFLRFFLRFSRFSLTFEIFKIFEDFSKNFQDFSGLFEIFRDFSRFVEIFCDFREYLRVIAEASQEIKLEFFNLLPGRIFFTRPGHGRQNFSARFAPKGPRRPPRAALHTT